MNSTSDPTLSSLTIAGFLDSATGRNASRSRGDYAAIATVGLHPSGIWHVLDLWLRRAAPTAQIEAVFDLHARWNYALFGIEMNCFQQLLLLPLEEERKRRKAAGMPWQLPVREVHHSRNKEVRIASLEPFVTNGWLRFAHDLPDMLWNEMQTFPHGEHDDGLDAIESAISLLQTLHARAQRGPARKAPRELKNY
ncbi:phage terminase large subunit [bacterium]|nr:phage terminase large subunit [bacterium]